MPVVNFTREVVFNDGVNEWNADSIYSERVYNTADSMVIKHDTGLEQSFNTNQSAGKELIKSIVPDNGICINHGK